MNLAPIVTRLQTACPEFRAVGGAAEYDAANTGILVAPAAFVVPLEDRAGENYLIGITAQRVEVLFGVIVLLTDFVNPASGERAMNDLETYRASVRAALHGWQPQADAEPCLISGGQLFSFEPGALWWQDVYRTAHDVRTTQ